MEESFAAFFSAELVPLHSYISRRVDSSVAEDVTAEAFAIAYRRWGERDLERPVRPWLYGIATNLLRHHWRGERRMRRAYAHAVTPDLVEFDDAVPRRLDAEAQKRALASALADLRPKEREILLLHAWADLTDVEIAEALSLPLGTVKSRLHRARQHLRNRIPVIGHLEVQTTTSILEIGEP
jgi:RNA polymerase sigma-70 factor (ECF subfamily)